VKVYWTDCDEGAFINLERIKAFHAFNWRTHWVICAEFAEDSLQSIFRGTKEECMDELDDIELMLGNIPHYRVDHNYLVNLSRVAEYYIFHDAEECCIKCSYNNPYALVKIFDGTLEQCKKELMRISELSKGGV